MHKAFANIFVPFGRYNFNQLRAGTTDGVRAGTAELQRIGRALRHGPAIRGIVEQVIEGAYHAFC